VVIFFSEKRIKSGQLGNSVLADCQLTRFIVPAALVLWFVRGGDAENPLPDTAL
jgi:hypothetical protein